MCCASSRILRRFHPITRLRLCPSSVWRRISRTDTSADRKSTRLNSSHLPYTTLFRSVMDVLRFEQDLAALSPDHQITPLSVFGMAQNFQNGYIGTWTAGVEQKLGGATLNAAYVGTAGIKLPVMDYPNGYIGADPTSAPYTQFDS